MSLLALQQDFEAWLTREPATLPVSFGERHRAGLAVYLNNYRAQLLACLVSSYPVVRRMMGDAAFDAAAARHIDARPPQSWTLDAYAEGFPAMLRDAFPDTPGLSELAQLELALAIAFVGPDAEPVDATRLAAVDWDAAVIHLVPTFSLLPVTTNAGAIWSAIDAGRAPPEAERLPEGEYLAVWRAAFRPTFRAVSPIERAALEQIREGAAFGAVCATLVHRLGEAGGTEAAGSMLGRWLSDGAIARIT